MLKHLFTFVKKMIKRLQRKDVAEEVPLFCIADDI